MTEASELAALVADTLAVLDALRRQGTDVLPVGALDGLGSAPAGASAGASVEGVAVSRPVAARAPVPAGAALGVPRATPAPTVENARGPTPAVAARPAPVAAPVVPARPAPAATPPAVPTPAAPVGPAAPVTAPAVGAPPVVAGAGLFGSKWARVAEGADAAAASLRAEILACTACGRCRTRAQAFPGDGAPRPMLVIVTDPPDAAGDAVGNVLTGEAAQMLDRMLLNVVRVDRREVLIVPVVRCGGPGPLLPEEVNACGPYLARQLTLAKPRAVLVLGEAARAALGLERHGTWGDVHGLPALSTFHPLWLLANPGDKRLALSHLQELAKRVG